MIIFKLDRILEQENISQNQFSKLSDVRPNTINNICNNNIRRLELYTLDKIMNALFMMGYSIEDFIVYVDTREKR